MGPQGATGATGAAGATGATGATGSSGTNGATGATGSKGKDGIDGAAGATGAAGPAGPTGPAGPQGVPGTTGAAGAAGPAGPQGSVGPTGPAGASGSGGTTVATSETRSATTYGDLTTVGPAATVTIPASGRAMVILTANEANSSATGANTYMGFAVSGATTIAPSDAQTFNFANGGAANTVSVQGSATYLVTGLTAGSNTFTAKYRVNGATGTWSNRSIVVLPLP
jgi:hypothetical protein